MSFSSRVAVGLFAAALPGACTFPEYDFAGATDVNTLGGAPSVSGARGWSADGGAGAEFGGAGGAEAPTCTDSASNGAESGVDCGGQDCAPCGNGQSCRENEDCASGRCDDIEQVCRPGLMVRCRCTESCAHGDLAISKMQFSLSNRSTEALSLDGVVLRYYFSQENAEIQALCASSGLPGSCAAIASEKRAYEPATPEATHVLELRFSAENGVVEPNTTTSAIDIELRASPSGHHLNQLNDYSFYTSSDPSPPVLDCERLTLHRITGEPGGALIWGTTP